MRKILSFLLVPLFIGVFALPATAVALVTYWDVTPYGTGDGITGDFDRILYEADTSSIQYDTNGDGVLSVGDIFMDTGNAYAHSLSLGGPVQNRGMNDSYTFTFGWNDLTGTVFDINPGVATDAVVTRYESGTIDFWLDDTAIGMPFLGHDFGTADDVNIDRGPDKLVATVSVTGGTGNITFDKAGNMLTGSYRIFGEFTDMADGFWFESATDADLNPKYVEIGWLLGFTSGENTPDYFDQTFFPEDDDILFRIDSRHSSNFNLEVIPEPSTIILLGAGLLGTGIMLRRKNRK